MKLTTSLFLLYSLPALAQFPGPAGTPGTTAMHADSSAFVAWATQCNVTRGPQDISNTSLGNATVGDSSMALGKAGMNGVVSLGDGGTAIVTFTAPITNGPGFDFAVFENSFSDTFLELAFVEVSSDGINFFRFPATSNSPVTPQYDNNANMDATKIDNLAGKYRAMYGTPFDLQQLSGIAQLDITAVTHVKIIDVVGSINPAYARYDKNSNIINDPWPTPFASSGFDLDAVGVIHQAAVGIREFSKEDKFTLYPNPCMDEFGVRSLPAGQAGSELGEESFGGEIIITDIIGKPVSSCKMDNGKVNVADLQAGIYFVHLKYAAHEQIIKLIKK